MKIQTNRWEQLKKKNVVLLQSNLILGVEKLTLLMVFAEQVLP